MAEKFEEKTPGEYDSFEKKGELYVPKEERGHIRSAEEVEKAKESIPEEKKIEGKEEKEKKTEDWYETFSKLGGTRRGRLLEQEYQKEKKAVETAEVPKEGMKLKDILKETGVEKPAESFEEVQKRLKEKIGKAGPSGEKLSGAEKIERTRNFYLDELGYKLEYKGLLRGKARIFKMEGEEKKYITDEKDKPREFKAFFRLKEGRTPLTDFLKEELKGKLEGKPEKKLTEEEKWEAGTQKAIKETKGEQEKREEKISSLADIKRVGKERLSKMVEGLSYVAALDKLGVLGLREGKKLAIEGGKNLTAIGLSPAVAIEEAGREITGRIQVGEALRKTFIAERKIEALEQISADKRPGYYEKLTDILKETSQKGTEEMIKGYDKIYKKGKILRFLETSGGRFGRAMGERLEPHPY